MELMKLMYLFLIGSITGLVSFGVNACPTAYSKLQCQECCPDDYLKEDTW